MDGENAQTTWRPDADVARRLTLAAILEGNPLPFAYRLNYLANSYVGPLIKRMERELGMTRSEWIVLFCLTRRSGLSAQQISDVTGRAKTSISAAVKQLQRKQLLLRSVDAKDGRRRVLQITEAGRRIYATIRRGRRVTANGASRYELHCRRSDRRADRGSLPADPPCGTPF